MTYFGEKALKIIDELLTEEDFRSFHIEGKVKELRELVMFMDSSASNSEEVLDGKLKDYESLLEEKKIKIEETKE